MISRCGMEMYSFTLSSAASCFVQIWQHSHVRSMGLAALSGSNIRRQCDFIFFPLQHFRQDIVAVAHVDEFHAWRRRSPRRFSFSWGDVGAYRFPVHSPGISFRAFERDAQPRISAYSACGAQAILFSCLDNNVDPVERTACAVGCTRSDTS